MHARGPSEVPRQADVFIGRREGNTHVEFSVENEFRKPDFRGETARRAVVEHVDHVIR